MGEAVVDLDYHSLNRSDSPRIGRRIETRDGSQGGVLDDEE